MFDRVGVELDLFCFTLWVQVPNCRPLAAACSGGVNRRGARVNTAVLTRTVVVRGCRDVRAARGLKKRRAEPIRLR